MTARRISQAELAGLVGQPLGASNWRRLDQTRIHDFGILTEDEQWVHLDVERATKELGGPIAHGFLTLAMLSSLCFEIWELEGATRILNYGFNRLRFPAPVPSGSAIRLQETLAEVEERGDGVLLTRDITIEIQGAAKPAVVGQWLALVYFS